ncbi:type II toxin-antitoxin system ParD family antitoxin [Trichocoleus sp. FACHB-90]|uniref:ribbon-helix-helix domain-containing protein n=1 Tax=Cyanophyceae TaxID=3028117 RepID=UPI00168A3116|nr:MULTISPECIES: type II toxin-antitoxin system ParD family antitoxin [unclassified Trichocoleus]MBD1929657.1 type II toxin-antitoxin system ParD family antitoxin [Trichocoleus sp. FACHB-90]MBD2002202.1 type II toxin-antitoxin system ParD family antitoxin [Trichocoleus sp. FACHB-40]
MSISLKPEQEQFIQEQLKTGKYQTVDQVIIEAFRLLEERDKDYEQWVQETREKIDAAAASLDRGEGQDGEEVVNRILERFRQVRQDRG